MLKHESLDKMQARQSFSNFWHTDLVGTMTADIPYFCFSLWCAPCASYLLRKRALYDDMSRYVCCAGYMPCSGSCGERDCPELCLCTEQVACIFSLVAAIVGTPELEDASQMLSCLSNVVYCSVCACMQTQHKVEMDKRDGKFGPMQPPRVQQMSRIDQAVPPAVGGYPPQLPPPVYGHPPSVYGQPYPPPNPAHYSQPHPPQYQYPPPPQVYNQPYRQDYAPIAYPPQPPPQVYNPGYPR